MMSQQQILLRLFYRSNASKVLLPAHLRPTLLACIYFDTVSTQRSGRLSAPCLQIIAPYTGSTAMSCPNYPNPAAVSSYPGKLLHFRLVLYPHRPPSYGLLYSDRIPLFCLN